MMIKLIESENPSNHWRFLDVKNKVVMDMGCSFWDSTWNEGWLSSTEYFVDRGAKKVVGFDEAQHDVDRYHQLYNGDERYDIFRLKLTEHMTLQRLLNIHKPQVIKCDIEGAEINFLHIDDLEGVEQIAIEYHNGPTKLMCETMMPLWGFENIELYQLHNNPIESAGVYNAWR